jgi:hypothetical protein
MDPFLDIVTNKGNMANAPIAKLIDHKMIVITLVVPLANISLANKNGHNPIRLKMANKNRLLVMPCRLVISKSILKSLLKWFVKNKLYIVKIAHIKSNIRFIFYLHLYYCSR